MALTVKGQPINQTQSSYASRIITIGTQLGASSEAIAAVVVEAIAESVLGLAMGWDAGNPTYGGLLAGSKANFGSLGGASSVAVTDAEIHACFEGGKGYQGGTIALTQTMPDLLQVAMTNSGSGNQFLAEPGHQNYATEARAIVTASPAGLTAGGVFGMGGTGVPGNQVINSLWIVGNSMNPDQDYWTTINQYGQNAQWYVFSDGETLFAADGFQIMAQTPAAVIVRTDPNVLSAELTYDNSAFQNTHTHTRKGRVQRRAALARMTSPTGAEIKLICPVDQFRGGDTVYLKQFGQAADGIWLVGECRRSLFDPFSTLTLTQAMMPINASSGLPLGPAYLSGTAASKAGSGTVIAAMISEASTVNAQNYPYEWGGGHAAAGTPSTGDAGGNHQGGYGQVGFDCSGSVAAVLASGGLWKEGASVPSSNGIVDALIAKGGLVAGGSGSGRPECTLFDNPTHIFMRLNGEYFGTADGSGHLPATTSQGVGWIPSGQPPAAGSFRVTHVLPTVLGQQPAQVTGVA